jgi:hypothetical protein
LGRALLAAVLLAGLGLRLTIALRDDGLFWCDEIFQSLEPAHWLTYGYGLLPWEYVDGLRSWTLPAILAGVLKLLDLGGLHEPRAYVLAIRFLFCGLGVGTAAATHRLARTFGASELASAVGAASFALIFPAVFFGPRAFTETACILPATLGFAWAMAPSRRDRILGASLLGLAVLLRLHAAIFCVGALATLGLRRSWRALGEVAAVFAGWAFLLGLSDRLTWGSWFHSALSYLDFTLLAHGAERWGASHFNFYAAVLWNSCPFAVVAFGLLLVAAARRAPGLLLTAAAYFLLHSWSPHKEFRYILLDLPFFGALGAIGLTALGERFPRLALPAATIAFLSLLPAARLLGTSGNLTQALERYHPPEDLAGSVDRLLFAAHDVPDLCGLRVESTHLAWTGGYSYLHRKARLYYRDGPSRETGLFNYVIASRDKAGAGSIVARDGKQVLIRIRDGCLPDPDYWRSFTARRPAGVQDPAPYLRPW